jgi:hypothetical protein
MSEVRRSRREFYRVEYPIRLRPTIVLAGRTHRVLDLSETGLRYLLGGAEPPHEGVEVEGEVCFDDGERCTIRGVRLRLEGETCALQLVVGMPLARVIAEQRLLRRTSLR